MFIVEGSPPLEAQGNIPDPSKGLGQFKLTLVVKAQELSKVAGLEGGKGIKSLMGFRVKEMNPCLLGITL